MTLRPGQCDIRSLSLTNHTRDSVYDIPKGILNHVQSVDLYESIFTPYITADVNINDGTSLKEKMNFSGGEDFTIKFLGYGDDNPVTYNMKVAEIGLSVVADNLRSKTYTLRMYSSEYLLNAARTVSKSYSTSASNIVSDLVSGFLNSEKPIYTDPTKDLPVVVIPYMDPMTAISFIRQRSVSTTNAGSPLLFFENQKGYFFTTTDSIFKNNGAGSSKVHTFFQKEGISTNVKGSQGSISDFDAYRLFSNYTVKTPVNVGFLLERGGLNTVVSEFDLNTKSFKKRLFSNTPSNKTFADPADKANSLLTDTIQNDYGAYTGKSFLVPFATYKDTTNRTANFIYDAVAEKYGYTNLLTQQKTYIDIPGNTQVMAGSIVYLNVPRHDSSFDLKDKNEYESGRYLVSSVRHSISVLADSKYSTHLELIRYGRGVLSK